MTISHILDWVSKLQSLKIFLFLYFAFIPFKIKYKRVKLIEDFNFGLDYLHLIIFY